MKRSALTVTAKKSLTNLRGVGLIFAVGRSLHQTCQVLIPFVGNAVVVVSMILTILTVLNGICNSFNNPLISQLKGDIYHWQVLRPNGQIEGFISNANLQNFVSPTGAIFQKVSSWEDKYANQQHMYLHIYAQINVRSVYDQCT